MNPYIGHSSQLYGVEEHRIVGGRGDGMRILEVHNGKGLDLTISLDRNADISRLRYKGINLSYMAPVGYAAPAYYDKRGSGWLDTFSGGFLATCGLNSVGTPCEDEGEDCPLHGSIGNTPCSQAYSTEEDGDLVIHTVTSDEAIFGRKLVLKRTTRVSTEENSFSFTDEIENTGDRREPFEVLYHMNTGYPLLDEDSILNIPSVSVKPRNAHAGSDIANWMNMEKPQAGYEEKCYYHSFENGNGLAELIQPKLGIKLSISFDSNELDGFVEWKMMGVRDYVLGLECGNCLPDGRDVMRRTGMLKFLDPGEKKTYTVNIKVSDI